MSLQDDMFEFDLMTPEQQRVQYALAKADSRALGSLMELCVVQQETLLKACQLVAP